MLVQVLHDAVVQALGLEPLVDRVEVREIRLDAADELPGLGHQPGEVVGHDLGAEDEHAGVPDEGPRSRGSARRSRGRASPGSRGRPAPPRAPGLGCRSSTPVSSRANTSCAQLDVAVAGLGTARPDADGRHLAALGAARGEADRPEEGLLVLDQVVGGEDADDGRALAAQGEQVADQGDRGSGVAPDRLEPGPVGRQAELAQDPPRQHLGVPRADEPRVAEGAQAAEGLGQERLSEQVAELLRHGGAGDRPEPGAAAAGQDDWDHRAIDSMVGVNGSAAGVVNGWGGVRGPREHRLGVGAPPGPYLTGVLRARAGRCARRRRTAGSA